MGKEICTLPVTKPFLPPVEEYETLLRGIWERGWLTNHGPLQQELEQRLQAYLGVPHMLYLTNGTVALQTAIRALNLHGEIITTPYSFIATSSSIAWEGCTPVYVDIDPLTLNINPEKIAAAITPRTSAILATHLYGNPCDIDAIETIARRHGLRVIYDAAHCFGTTYKGRSVFCYGDISITSFHATKVYHTIEGGAVFASDETLLRKLTALRNFGLNGSDGPSCIGTNGKNSEFHAAMGLLNLNYVDAVLEKRRSDFQLYRRQLRGLHQQQPATLPGARSNYSYFPITLPSERLLQRMVTALTDHDIFPKRYFYPSLQSLPLFGGHGCPISQDLSARTVCLPMYHSISPGEISLIASLLLETQNS